jgi:iron(III) transport system ATP-binding protein
MTIKSNAASVRFDAVTKAFGDVVAVDQISLMIEPGKLVTLLGPSGCGKTTTLRLIAGLEMATGGQIFIGDRDVTRLPATDRDVAMVFQSYALFPHMTVGENVAYGLKVSGVKKTEARARSRDALNLVGLADLGARMPSELSGGQQQRVAVARALVLEPQVLLFDEPLSNLDAKLRRRVREEIREIQQNLGLTVIYVTHDQEEALAVSDSIVVMNNAVIAQIGTPRELYEVPSDAFVADFIGEANILDCEIESVAGDMAQVRLGDIVMQLPALNLDPGPAQLAIRPRRVDLHAEVASATIRGTLLKATYVGTHMEYRIETAHGEIFAISGDVDGLHGTGSEIRVGFRDPGPVLLPAT